MKPDSKRTAFKKGSHGCLLERSIQGYIFENPPKNLLDAAVEVVSFPQNIRNADVLWDVCEEIMRSNNMWSAPLPYFKTHSRLTYEAGNSEVDVSHLRIGCGLEGVAFTNTDWQGNPRGFLTVSLLRDFSYRAVKRERAQGLLREFPEEEYFLPLTSYFRKVIFNSRIQISSLGGKIDAPTS